MAFRTVDGAAQHDVCTRWSKSPSSPFLYAFPTPLQLLDWKCSSETQQLAWEILHLLPRTEKQLELRHFRHGLEAV